MSGWRRCDTCRKVRSADDFDGDATTCRACLSSPTPSPRKRTAAVTTRTTTPRPPAAAPAERGPRLGSVGSGDLEVRERRARRSATDVLVDSHPDEFALLLRDARAREGLRPMSVEPSADATPEPTPAPSTAGQHPDED